MSRLGALPRTLLLALLGVAGIVGMLLADGVGDAVFFLLAAAPLVAGGWYGWTMRRAGAARTGHAAHGRR
ncbi:hypothetical protein [Fulvimonas soli]|jgi:hypothetical protein|uniref:Uncharacterized protein n=1 Tax=Fulvimonas soli TaxID=155197 RepID=A0A316HQP8_9GAMM|nr:hypothetical protein [Fulvimonas soli]PWK82722.1 hypothetical protein C7456_11519 [Fulvimonas soli]